MLIALQLLKTDPAILFGGASSEAWWQQEHLANCQLLVANCFFQSRFRKSHSEYPIYSREPIA
ncbi:MAG TPA: hypothetical protein VJV96_13860, partial [Candidatus Angelobacter sp.]|nr:hypothetical protein [Candidatus Angelobacter sp.]